MTGIYETEDENNAALMLGGWIAVAVAGAILSLTGIMIGGVFSGLASVASGLFPGSGFVPGIVIGLAAFCCFRNRNTRNAAETEEK